ncbi:hypothetical protein SAMN05216569_2183 [Pseudoxanthomonas sp. CF125]|nr:hypothetical protein SAMN05216569_2183 [Pseudoxanthomonas sp. CF125]
MHKWIAIATPDDYAQLASIKELQSAASTIVERLKEHLTDKVKGVLVEYPYVDKDYRSTYYGFYAKKGQRYDPFCVRLHFFNDRVRLTEDLTLETTSNNLSKDYFGYMIVRPTIITPIGRTILSIDIVKEFSGAIIDAKYTVHVLGYRLEVNGFPFMQQHTDISVCAHAACWGILRHYSERYRAYAERLVYDITKMAGSGDPGGLTPSRGLVVPQASQIFSQAGLYPDVYGRRQFKANFERLMMAYVESGFPVFAAMQSRQHAISVIGHGSPDRNALQASQAPQYAWDATQSFYVVDDNRMPYQLVDGLDAADYKISDIDAFIVPLPEKIFFPGEAVERHVEHLLSNGILGLDFSFLVSPVIRYFVTTSAALKRYFKDNKSQFPPDLYTALVELVLPQFVWIAELASLTEWQHKRFNSLMIFDATASALEPLPYFVVMDQKRALIFDRAISNGAGYIEFGDHVLNPMSEFRNLQSRL